MWDMCIRCGEHVAATDEGFCGHCHWAFRAEVEEGILSIVNYLRLAWEFQEWLVSHGRF